MTNPRKSNYYSVCSIVQKVDVRELSRAYVPQSNRFLYEWGKMLLDGGSDGRFELRPLGNNTYRLMESPRRFVFTFFKRPDSSLAVLIGVEGSQPQKLRIYGGDA